MTPPPSHNRSAELEARLKALCPMRCREVRLGEQALRVWTACDLDPLLEALAQKPADHPDVTDERLPYWAELWPSSRVLAECILTSEQLPAGPWLELGCGPGLAGLAATRRGVQGIWTDYMEPALWLAELNALTLGCPHPQTQQLDWRHPPVSLRVPWILAADVAYEKRNFEPLLSCFDQLLLPGGEIWFGEPGRPVARDFIASLAGNGWEALPLLQMDTVTVYRLRRRPESHA